MARFAVGLSLVFPFLFSPLSSAQKRRLQQTPTFGVRSLAVPLVFLYCVGIGKAQTSTLGVQMFSTNNFGVDLATSNINIAVPIRSKIGKIPFSSQIVGTSTMLNASGTWNPPLVNASQYANGFSYTDIATHVAYGYAAPTKKGCSDNSSYYTYYSETITDSTGASHTMYVGVSGWNGPGLNAPGPSACFTSISTPVLAGDGSGYQLTVSNGIASIHDKYGTSYGGCTHTGYQNPNCTLTSITDVDGATISRSPGLGDVPITDTLNTTVLMWNVTGGSCPSGSSCYQYTDASGATQQVAVNYTTKNVLTNFECANVPGEFNQSLSVVSSITLPTGAQYVFSYEPTPGHSGYYTGRIQQITLPSGGYVKYTYSDSTGNNGINCNSFVVPTLKVEINDNSVNDGTWNYVNSNNSNTPGNFTVTETDPAGNQTIYSFAGEYQTQAVYYQGTSTVLKTVTTCYGSSGLTPPVPPHCAIPATIPTLPITETDVYTSLNASANNRIQTTFDTYGNVTSVLAYDFGISTPMTKVFNVYGRVYSSPTACTAYASGTYIYNTPCYSHTENSSGTDLAKTKVSYNADGKPASISKWTGATENTWLTTSFGYGANGAAPGVLSSVTDVNNAPTTYGNFACNGMLPGLTTYPLSLSASRTYDTGCIGGVVTSTTDANNQVTHYYYNDPLWRQTEVDNPDGGTTTTTYNTGTSFPWTIATCSTINTGSSCPAGTNSLTGLTKLDGLGRAVQTQRTSDPNGTSYADTTYDVLGRVASTSNPYYTSGDPTYGVTGYAYDALGRVTTITNPDSSQRLMAYSGAWANVQDEGNGTNRVIKLYQRDGLGRLVAACEVTSAHQMGNGSPASCGAYGANGFLSSYIYDALGNITYMTQGAQNRTFNYDGLSRLTVDANPEAWGPTTYTYDAATAGDLYQRSQPKQNLASGNGNWTATYSFDALHRMTGVSYNDGTTPNAQWAYDSSNAWGKQGSHTKGRLVATQVNNQSTGALIAGEGFITYDPMGRVQWRLQNGQGPEYDLNYTYDHLGDVLTASNSAGVTLNSTYNTAAELSGVTSSLNDANHPGTLWEGPQYNALGQVTTDNLGFLNEHYGYTNRGWLFSYWACTVPGNSCSSSQMAYTFNMQTGNNQQPLGFAPNGDIQVANDWINGNWTYAYDDFNRLSTSSCGTNCPGGQSALGFNYLYDRFGNRWQQNGTAGSGPHPQYSFDGNGHINSGGVYYDAAGNMIGDTSHTYIYDAENRVIQVDGTSGQCSTASACYVYNASRQRVTKTTSAGTVYYVYDIFGYQVAEFSSSGAWNRGEVYAGSKHLATYVGGTGGSTYLDLADWVGSERMRVNSKQSPQETCTSLPFGDMQSCTGTDESPMHFTGQQWDSEDNMTNFWFRQHSPTQGRWGSMDPSGLAAVDSSNPQTWNRYAYVMNNPLSATDPTGLGSKSWSCGPFRCGPTPQIAMGGWNNPCDHGKTECPSFDLNPGNVAGWDEFGLMNIPVRTYGCYGDCGYYVVGFVYDVGGGGAPGQTGNAANNGLTISAAPPTPWYKNPCVTKAIAKGALSTGIDAIGLIPGGGAVSAELSLFNGAAAVSNGTAILGRLQLGAGIITAANGASDTSALGAVQTVAGVGGIVAGVAKATPVVGQVLSGISVGLDLIGTGMNIAQCY